MKYFLTLIISFMILNLSFAQYKIDIDSLPKQDLPTWFIHKGDTVGLVFSIQQVQKMDSDLELLSWLEKKGFTCDSTISAYIKVIDEYGRQVTILKTNISELTDQVKDKDSQIKKLNDLIDNYKKDLDLAKSQIKDYEKIVSNNKTRITNLKIQRNLSIGGGVFLTAAAAVITFLIIR